MIEAIKRGITYLCQTQQSDGSFLSLSNPYADRFNTNFIYKTTFSTSLILSCLQTLGDRYDTSDLKQRAATYLMTQKSKTWSFNYWDRSSKEATSLPYPDDLDDTFCALAALYQTDPKLIDGKALAKILTLLTELEVTEGGPYRTWLVPETADPVWRDVDLAVNANIAYFLSLHEVTLPNLTTLTEAAISEGNYRSLYYPSPYPPIYFIARWYKDAKQHQLIEYLEQQKEGNHWGNPLFTSLALSARARLGDNKQVNQAITYLTQTQLSDGSWPAIGFCLDPSRNKQPHYHGSPALTTAFVLEALSLLKQGERQPIQARDRINKEQRRIHQRVVERLRTRFGQLDDPLKTLATTFLEQFLESRQSHRIALLPTLFYQSIQTNKIIPDSLLVKLGVANTCGWIAYTIYDDFLDEEGQPRLLPIANLCLRELTCEFENVSQTYPDFRSIFNDLMDRIDEANSWEVVVTRDSSKRNAHYGNLRKLADRSIGQALGPIAILFALGYRESSALVKETLAFFERYLIARQLNDDAHDWERDFRRGHISAVVALLFKEPQLKRLIHQKITEKVLTEIRFLYWQKIMPRVSKRILAEVVRAKEIWEEQPLFQDELANILIGPLEKSIKEAMSEQEKTLQFIAEFKSR